MIELFEENYIKMTKIIKMLLFSDSWKTKKKLADYAGCSESTFIRYMQEIKLLWGDILKIETSKKLGYRIKNCNISNYISVIKDMSKKSVASQLLHEIIIHPGKNIEYYCTTLNISPSSFARKLKQCNKILEDYNISLSVNDGYHLLGENEKRVRIFITYFLLEFYGHNSLPFSLEQDKVKIILRKNKCRLNWINKENTFEHIFFTMLFIVHLMRESQGVTLHKNEKTLRQTLKTGGRYFKSKIVGLTCEIYNKVVKYFCCELLQWPSTSEQMRIEKLIEENLEKSSFANLLDFDENSREFVTELVSHVYLFNELFPFYTNNLDHRISIFSDQVKHNDSHLFTLLQKDLKLFSIVLDADLKNYFAIYIFWFLTGRPEFTQYFSSKKILAVSDLGFQHAEVLANHVSSELANQQISIRVVPACTTMLSQYDFSDFDLIVSNQPMRNNPLPVFLINDDFTGFNIQKLIDILSPSN